MLLGDSQEDSLSLLIIKKISFLAKAVKILGEPKAGGQYKKIKCNIVIENR